MFSRSLQLVFPCLSENDVHPHVSEEKAELFHAIDSASAELEVLNFLNALVYLHKPSCVVETGTHCGFSAIATAAALKANGFGKLHTIEHDPDLIEVARRNIQIYDPELMQYIEIHCSDSRQWLSRYEGAPFDFAFFDTELAFRQTEFEIIMGRNLFSYSAMSMFHDTSKYRERYFDDCSSTMLAALARMTEAKQTLDFCLSRGLRIFKVFS